MTDSPKKKRDWIEDDFFSLAPVKKSKKRSKKHEEVKHEGVKHEEVKHKEVTEPVVKTPKSPESNEVQDVQLEKDLPRPITVDDSDEELSVYAVTTKTFTLPPLVDREALREEIEKKFDSPKASREMEFDDDSDIEDVSSHVSDLSGRYQFSEENERKRMYIIKVYTKLPIPVQQYDPSLSSDFGAKGSKKFERILEAVNQHFQGFFKEWLPSEQLDMYDISKTALIWIDGRMELKGFYKPSTLRIPPPGAFDVVTDEIESMSPTEVNCLLIPKENVPLYLEIYPEFKKPVPQPEPDIPEVEQAPEVEVVDVEEVVEEPVEETPKNQGYFKIGLKGRDNKRIEVEVSEKTQVRKLLDFYVESKGIEGDISKAKLIFDDEEIDMDCVVGDTELEEDFEVQVVL